MSDLIRDRTSPRVLKCQDTSFAVYNTTNHRLKRITALTVPPTPRFPPLANTMRTGEVVDPVNTLFYGSGMTLFAASRKAAPAFATSSNLMSVIDEQGDCTLWLCKGRN